MYSGENRIRAVEHPIMTFPMTAPQERMHCPLSGSYGSRCRPYIPCESSPSESLEKGSIGTSIGRIERYCGSSSSGGLGANTQAV